MRWDKTIYYKPEKYPGAGLENNYCRNPDGTRNAWCFISEYGSGGDDDDYYFFYSDWEECDVPTCEDSLPSAYPSSSLLPSSTFCAMKLRPGNGLL